MLIRMFGAAALALGFAANAQAAPSCLGGPSTQVKISGSGVVSTPKVYTPAMLAARQTSKMTVSYFSGASGLVTKTFVGVPLYDLIQEVGVTLDSTRKNDMLRKYMTMTATDCYQVVVAMAEIQPSVGGQQVMVAFAQVDAAGEVIPLDDNEGALKLVVPGDKAGARQVFHLSTIAVRNGL